VGGRHFVHGCGVHASFLGPSQDQIPKFPIGHAQWPGSPSYARANATSNAIGYAKFYSRSHDAVIRVYDEEGNVIETHAHKCEFKEW
jgi:hypothetical protein